MSQAEATSGARILWLALAVAALAAGIHLGALANDFTFDDAYIIKDNPLVTGAGGLLRVFSTHYWASADPRGDLYRPVTVASYGLNYRLAGASAWSFHLVNVLLHGAVAGLLCLLFERLTRSAASAGAGALLFASHPVHVEAVASVVGRAELLAALFVLSAWLLRERRVVAIVLFGCGLLSKESAVVLPALLMLEDLLGLGHTGPSGRRARPSEYLPYLIAIAAFLLLRGLVVGDPLSSAGGPFAQAPSFHRLLTAVAVLGRYLFLMLWPATLSADYSFNQVPLVSSALDRGFLIGSAAVGCCAGIAWIMKRRLPEVSFGVAAFFLALAPVSNVAFGIGVIMAERLLYLPSAGLCLAVGAVLAAGTRRLLGLQGDRLVAACCLAALVPGSVLAARSMERTRDWRDALSLFSATTRDAPASAMAHFGLATAYQELGRFEEAESAYRRCLAIAPDRAETHYDLGVLLGQMERQDEAMRAYQEAVRLDPSHAKAHNNLGTMYQAIGRMAEAEAAYRRAIQLDPGKAGPLANLASLLEAQGRAEESLSAAREAAGIEPESPRVLTNLGRALLATGRVDEAIAVLQRATELHPENTLPAVNLAAACFQRGDLDRAERIARQVLASHSEDPGARRLLAAIAARRGASSP